MRLHYSLIGQRKAANREIRSAVLALRAAAQVLSSRELGWQKQSLRLCTRHSLASSVTGCADWSRSSSSPHSSAQSSLSLNNVSRFSKLHLQNGWSGNSSNRQRSCVRASVAAAAVCSAERRKDSTRAAPVVPVAHDHSSFAEHACFKAQQTAQKIMHETRPGVCDLAMLLLAANVVSQRERLPGCATATSERMPRCRGGRRGVNH